MHSPHPASFDDVTEQFRDSILANGIPYAGEIIADGKLHRVDADGDVNNGPEPPPHDEVPDYVPEHVEAAIPVARKARAKAATKPAAVPAADEEEEEEEPDGITPDCYFTVLGHDRDCIYVYSHEKKMVVRRSETAWTKDALFSIAPQNWWEMYFPGQKTFVKDAAVNWLLRTAFRRGFYDPSLTRGRGAWVDEGRIIYHFGHTLMVDGVEAGVTRVRSKYVYEQGRALRLPSESSLSNEDGLRIFEIAKMFPWAKPGPAVLLTGFVALAPFCGALKWRPHVWLTGAAGSGKTTIENDFVSFLLAGTAVFAQGGSTEAGIRQNLRCDALPVLFDESEQGDERAEQRVQQVIGLVRQASSESGAKTYKGTANGDGAEFLIRSMFGLSSIQVNIKNDADRDRLTILALLSPRRDGQADHTWPMLRMPSMRSAAIKTCQGASCAGR